MWSLALYLSQGRTLKPAFPSLPQTWRSLKSTIKCYFTDLLLFYPLKYDKDYYITALP